MGEEPREEENITPKEVPVPDWMKQNAEVMKSVGEKTENISEQEQRERVLESLDKTIELHVARAKEETGTEKGGLEALRLWQELSSMANSRLSEDRPGNEERVRAVLILARFLLERQNNTNIEDIKDELKLFKLKKE
ncbi:MAG: hypothetical protein ABSA74_01100 [Candidatus Staskawiczbacteria bacterium]|jgi:hypothetical protein